MDDFSVHVERPDADSVLSCVRTLIEYFKLHALAAWQALLLLLAVVLGAVIAWLQLGFTSQ
jgi:cytochrome c oxidase subunit IV